MFGPTIKSQALGRILAFEQMMHRRMGLVRPQRYIRLWNYYAGTNLPPENVEMPVGVNYVKAICDKHVAFFFGETDDNLMEWAVRPRNKAHIEDTTAVDIRQYIEGLWDRNKGNQLLWAGAVNGSIYGDTVFRLRADPAEKRVVIEGLVPEYFHCRWDTADMTRLIEVIIAYPIARDEAYRRYGTNGNDAINYQMVNPDYVPGMGIYWEHWTPRAFSVWIDDVVIIDEQPNPYMWVDQEDQIHEGVIPFIHIPNMRSGDDFWGFADCEAILLMQDEINRRLGDQGDIVNNHAHPIVTLNKFHGDVEDLPVGPDAVWNMGTDGVAGLIEAKGTPMSIEYLGLLQMAMMDTASMPEVAFGRQSRGNGRAQSSATAMQLILLPVVERSRRKRVQWSYALEELIRMAMHMQQMIDPDQLGFTYSQINNYTIRPQWGPILPKDRLAAVNENVALVVNGLRSVERALEDLGEDDIDDQIKKIRIDMQWRAMTGAGGQNSDQGQGGSNQLPGGAGSKTGKPGALIPDPDANKVNPGVQNYETN